MAFRSQRVVPGSGGGNRPDRTQFENVVGERLQYAAACCRFSRRGVSCRGNGVAEVSRVVFEVMAEMTWKVAPVRAVRPMRPLIGRETLISRMNDREARQHELTSNANRPYPIAFRSPVDFS